MGAYFPNSSGSEVYGPFTVQLSVTDSASPYVVVRDFIVTFSGKVNIRSFHNNYFLVMNFVLCFFVIFAHEFALI